MAMQDGLSPLREQVQQRLAEVMEQLERLRRSVTDLEAQKRKLEAAAAALAPHGGSSAKAGSSEERRDPNIKQARLKLSPRTDEQAVLAYIKARPDATETEITDATRLTKPVVERTIADMVSSGEVQAVELRADEKGYRVATAQNAG